MFPVFLGSYWSAGDPGTAVTSRLTWATAIGSIVVCLAAPVLGAIADAGGLRKRFLVVFTLLGALSTAALSTTGEGEWISALAFFVLASIGYYCAAIFYDALLVDACPPKHYNVVSSLGLSLGYFGGALLLSVHVWMIADPQRFGLEDAVGVAKIAFVSVGVWWLMFLLPVTLFVQETRQASQLNFETIRAAYRALRTTIGKIREYRNIVRFLTAYCFYIGGVFTVIFMAVNFGQRLGFEDSDLVLALMITNYVGFPATLAFGFLAQKFGTKNAIITGLFVYATVMCAAIFVTDVRQFLAMSITIGMVQGGVQSISRSLYAALIPAHLSGEFFGFYNMLTKFAHVIGPVLIGVVVLFSDDPKFVLIGILPLFVLGVFFLSGVKPDESTG